MRPTKQEIVDAVGRLGILKFFPSGDNERKEIMRFVERLVGTTAQLNWLVGAVIDGCNEWPGPKELRGIFCTRYRPADGVEAECSVSGFTASDGERKFQERQSLELESPAGQKLIEGSASPEELTESEESKVSTLQLAKDGVKSMRRGPVMTPEWLDRVEGIR